MAGQKKSASGLSPILTMRHRTNRAKKIVETVTNGRNCGWPGSAPPPRPRRTFVVIRSPHKYSDPREHFEMRTHKVPSTL